MAPGQRPDFNVTVVETAASHVIVGAGELDVATAPALIDAVSLVLDENATGLQLDLAAVTFIDSVGIGTLITIHKWALERGAKLGLMRPSAPVLNAIHLTGVQELFEVAPS